MYKERLSPQEFAVNYAHLTRYKFAAQFVSNKVVLDIACGCGAGTALLTSSNPSLILGMDIDGEAIQIANQSNKTGPKLLAFIVGDAEHIPLPDSIVDVVVCLEAVEHFNNDAQALCEVFRVLGKNGIVVLSTPNANCSQSVNGVPKNPYHVREYKLENLLSLLSMQFQDIKLYGQRVKGTVELQKISNRIGFPFISRRFLDIFPIRWRQALPGFLPIWLADWLVYRLADHHYRVRESDFEFENWGLEHSPVLIAVCEK